MNPYTALLAAQHLEDMQREADHSRLANVARRGFQDPPDDVSGLNRLAARSARSLSVALASLAARIDPVDVRRPATDDRKTGALAA
jgi:hypothetical protein